MKHKFIPAAITALSLLFGTVANAAGNELPISHGNRYTVTRDGGGEITYTVPFTANYEVTLSGSEGAGYPSGAGGYGYTLTTTVRLNKGQTITVATPNRPAHYTEGTTTIVPHGNDSVLKIDDKEFLRAGGGAPRFNQIIASTGTINVQVEGVASLPVHWHSGNGKSGATHANQFPTVYSETLVGGCYGWAGHTHNATSICPKSHSHNDGCYGIPDSPWNNCADCTSNGVPDGAGYKKYHCNCCGSDFRGTNGWHHCPSSKHFKQVCHDQPLNTWNCGNQPVNTQTIKCGFQHGQINPVTNQYTPTPCSGTWDSAASNNTGDAKFTVELCEQDTVYYDNGLVKDPVYKGGPAELVLVDGTVCHYKRR